MRFPNVLSLMTFIPLALGGCTAKSAYDAGSGRANTPSAATRLAGLSPQWQRAMLLQAIVGNGDTCDHVIDARYQQQVRGLAMWTARCHDGSRWAVYVGDAAVAQVAPCSEMAASGLPACAKPAQARKKS